MIKLVEIDFQDKNQATVYEGENVAFEAKPSVADGKGAPRYANDSEKQSFTYKWYVTRGGYSAPIEVKQGGRATLRTADVKQHGKYTVRVEVSDDRSKVDGELEGGVEILPAPIKPPVDVRASHTRSVAGETADVSFWHGLRHATAALSFARYQEFIDEVMCPNHTHGKGLSDDERNALKQMQKGRGTPFPGTDAYQLLKVATEVYLKLNCAVLLDYDYTNAGELASHNSRHGHTHRPSDLKNLWTEQYLTHVNGKGAGADTLPYLALIRRKLGDYSIIQQDPKLLRSVEICDGIMEQKLTRPCFIELIWSYWYEEGMLVQTLNAIALRFQNQRTGVRDPLATFDIDPLRPLSNLLWGYIQDEQHRLTVARRAYEYDHHYGISLHGKAVPALRSADSRSKFLEAFHNLLTSCVTFYKQDDNTMIISDAFAVLNALKEVHQLLTEGQHNQFGDLPFTARIEMLMQQWILARPEMREFLGGRTMVAYGEPWMERVDAMKKLQNWTDVSITYFGDLARFGEQLLLSIRYGNWSEVSDADSAKNWARDCRSEVKQYIHAYRAATGVDLAPEATGPQIADRDLAPSVHLRRRLETQQGQPPSRDPIGPGTPFRPAAGRNGAKSGARVSARPPTGTQAEVEFNEEF